MRFLQQSIHRNRSIRRFITHHACRGTYSTSLKTQNGSWRFSASQKHPKLFMLIENLLNYEQGKKIILFPSFNAERRRREKACARLCFLRICWKSGATLTNHNWMHSKPFLKIYNISWRADSQLLKHPESSVFNKISLNYIGMYTKKTIRFSTFFAHFPVFFAIEERAIAIAWLYTYFGALV